MKKNNPFLSEYENTLTNDYISKGFFVGQIQEKETIFSIKKSFIDIARKELGVKQDISDDKFLDLVHEYVPINKLKSNSLSYVSSFNK